MSQFKDLTGKKFNRLTVIKHHGINKWRQHTWECKCDCGGNRLVYPTSGSLNSGNSKSCGCLQKEAVIQHNKDLSTHNKTNTRLFHIWHGMKLRCSNKKSKDYKNYGGRGITVCDEWINDFKVFYDWAINNGYSDELSIDRKNVFGNYEPDNCRWSTDKVQFNNKRVNRYITINGVTKTVVEWAEEYNIGSKTLLYRLNNKWQVDQLFIIPNKGRKIKI
jgi:hypothetical protein